MEVAAVVEMCAICKSGIEADDALVTCRACKAPYHADCWEENRGCAIYGCEQAPPTEALRSVEIPLSYWGQEKNACPACGAAIMAVAVRCRQCGAEFSSMRPETAAEFRKSVKVEHRLP